MFNFGILGNNARNLHYIKKWNPQKTVRLADNKLQTKEFLGARNIPFAETYAVIHDRKQLAHFDFSQIPNQSFVIKPNHGSKGKGILVLKRGEMIDKPDAQNLLQKISRLPFFKTTEKNPEKQLSFFAQGKMLTEYQLRRRCLDILDGKYSMTLTDKLIIEEKLIPGKGFESFCEYGLADIRIITFNLVPVAAMIRIPTKKSEGKANIAAGGIGAGIDLGSGELSTIFLKRKLYTNKFPNEYAHLQGKKIPFWDDLLFLSSKVQYFVNLGYLALDRVITTDGPKLLEINARAGLEVQNIADIKLKRVLDKIEDLKIEDPEKGVQITKALFSKANNKEISKAQILYLSQTGELRIFNNDNEENYPVVIEIDLKNTKNTLSPELFERFQNTKDATTLLKVSDDISLKSLKFHLGEGENKVVLGQKLASKFLIKPTKKDERFVNILNPKKIISIELGQLHQIDQKVERISRRLNLTKRLRPTNYFNELDRFIAEKGNYNPIFEYKFPSLELQEKWQDEIKSFQEQLETSYLKSPMLNLFKEKMDELAHRSKLLQAYTKQDFKTIEKENIALFGAIDEKLFQESKEKLFNQPASQTEKEKHLHFNQIHEFVEKYLSEKGIFGVDIIENVANFSRMSVSTGKNTAKLNIAKNLNVSEKELKSMLAHEVDIHLVRYLNGLKSGWNVFKSGTGYYLKDEEGLAVWNAMQILPEREENLAIYRKYYLLGESKKHNFSKMVDLMYFLNPNRSYEGLFKSILRLKKGQVQTEVLSEGYLRMKDKIYLDGYSHIKEQNIDLKTLERLKKGKIKTKDLGFII